MEEGTLVVAAEAGEAPYVAALEVSAGATVKIPDCGLRVGALIVESGAIVGGKGTLTVEDPSVDLSNIRFEDGATVALTTGKLPFVSAEGSVPGNPALWLDASKTSSFDFDTDGVSVLKWRDVRATGTMFCTNIVVSPKLVSGDKPYVKFANVSTYNHADMQMLVWSKVVRGIKAIFMVVDPTDGGGVVLGRTMRLTTDNADGGWGGAFYRNPIDNWARKLFSADSLAGANSRAWYVNGEPIQPTVDGKGYAGPGLQVLEGHLTGDGVPADAFGCAYRDGYAEAASENGRQRIAECIIYTNELTSAERLEVAQYLSRRWRGQDIHLPAADASQTVSSLDAENGGLSLDADSEMVVGDVTGGGTLVKKGAGTLYVNQMTNGSLRVAEGTVSLRSMSFTSADVPTKGCWVHFAADEAASLVTNLVDGTNFVSTWTSLCGDAPVVAKRTQNGGARDGWLLPNALNGLPVVDLGPLDYSSANWGSHTDRTMEFYKGNGTRYDSRGADAPKLYTAFFVYGSQGGGNSLLGARGDNYPAYGLMMGTDATTHAPLRVFDGKSSTTYTIKVGWQNGQVEIRQDGAAFEPFTTGFSGGYNMLSYAAPQYPVQGASLAGTGYDNWAGGLRYGEVILYSDWLSRDDRALVEAYLAKKWFGRTTPGYATATLDALTVESGATLKVTAGGVVMAKALVGSGTVDGSVALATASEVVLDVLSNGSVAGQDLTGSLSLPSAAVVSFAGNVAALRPGKYAVLSAAALMGDVAGWAIDQSTGPISRFDMTLSVEDCKVYLTVSKRGFLLLVK